MKSKEDFLLDPEFVRWVKHPTLELEEYWSGWIAANPSFLPELLLAREILSSVKYPDIDVPKGKKEVLLERILKVVPEIDDNRYTSDTNNRNQPLISRFSWVFRLAAILVIGGVIAWYKHESVKNWQVQNEFDAVEYAVRKTQAGEKVQFLLEDGTRVWLNSSTEITYPKKFSETDRSIFLVGEAYFEVISDSLRPFKVMTGDLVTTVLGTSFNIAAKDLRQVQVTLVEGSVCIHQMDAQDTLVLRPGEMMTYHVDSQEKTRSRANLHSVSAWKNGIIVFKDASFFETMDTLEEWYGVNIKVISSRDARWKLNAEYDNETLENVLKSLSYVHKFQFKMEGKQVTINY